MKLSLIKKLLTDEIKSDKRKIGGYVKELNDALSEVNELERLLVEHHDSEKYWQGEVGILSVGDIYYIINVMGYDYYGEVARRHTDEGPVPLDKALAHLRKCHMFMTIADKYVLGGLEVVRDLWGDNEALGYNDAEGHFYG